MSNHSAPDKPSYILSVLKTHCSRCRRGKMFQTSNPYALKTLMKMHERCPVCNQPLDMEPGFYYGTGYVSYALATALSGITFALWWIFLGFPLRGEGFFWWLGSNAVLLLLLQPYLMRLSRTVWLSFFVPYSPDWDKGDIIEPERVNKDQQHNW